MEESITNNINLYNCRNKDNQTLYELALDKGHFRLIKTLAKLGLVDGEINFPTNSSGWTLLTKASAKSAYDIADFKYFIDEVGADVNAIEWAWGSAPLMHAAQQGNLPLVELLIRRGAKLWEVNHKTMKTAYGYADPKIKIYFDEIGFPKNRQEARNLFIKNNKKIDLRLY